MWFDCATFTQVWDFSSHLNALAELESELNHGGASVFNQAPVVKYRHKDEGYAIDWSAADGGSGRLLSGILSNIVPYIFFIVSGFVPSSDLMVHFIEGDCNNNIHLWMPSGATWNVDTTPFVGHTDSVEDIQVDINFSRAFSLLNYLAFKFQFNL